MSGEEMFASRRDSIKGLFYASKMQLFRKDSKISPSDSPPPLIHKKSIMKPKEFDKDQEKRAKYLKNKTFQFILKIKPKNVQLEGQQVKENANDNNHSSFRSAAKKILSTIVIYHAEDGWNLEEHGGIKMWVNAKTGEVSVENPSQMKSNLRQKHTHRRRGRARSKGDPKTLRQCSTSPSINRRGSVYCSSNKELQDIYDLLNPKSMLRFAVIDNEYSNISQNKLQYSKNDILLLDY